MAKTGDRRMFSFTECTPAMTLLLFYYLLLKLNNDLIYYIETYFTFLKIQHFTDLFPLL